MTRTYGHAFVALGLSFGCTDRPPGGPTIVDAPAPSAIAPRPLATVTPAPAVAPSTPGPRRATPRDEMVDVPAGHFHMGCRPTALPTCAEDARPRHRVWLDAYAIDKYEVTVGDYALCLASGECWKPYCGMPTDGDDRPIRCVDRGAARAYCVWMNKRLPTEAEWERAARGLDDRPFPWGEESPEERACWEKSAPCDVGSFPRGISPVGAYDMAGNVSEWVSDNYVPDYYRRSPKRNPQGYSGPPVTLVICNSPGCGVTRGGDWASPLEHLATTHRTKQPIGDTGPWRRAGFRCARTSAGP